MPRKKLVRDADAFYHVTNRTNNKDWFAIPLDEVWKMFLSHLELARLKWNLEIVSFVLMGNHYHILLRTPDCNIDKAMHCLNHRLSLKIAKRSQRINKIWSGRYRWSIVDNESYFFMVYRYIYQNPIRSSLCENVLDYPYSSLALCESSHSLRDKYGETIILNENLLEWLNEIPVEKEKRHQNSKNGQRQSDSGMEESERIRRGLRKTVFSPVF